MTWIDIFELDRLPVDRGVAALIGDQQVAVFRLSGDEVVAIDHVEPWTGMPVLARGLVGSTDDVTTVASPLHKQRFDLHSGRCLDDAEHPVRVWPTEVVDGVVRVADQPRTDVAAS